jgi:hypothetical protein
MLFITRQSIGPAAAVAPYAGDWRGVVKSGESSAPLELVLGRNAGEWQGSLILFNHAAPILDVRPLKNAVAFRVPSQDGDLLFRGRIIHDKIIGTLESETAAPVSWEVTRTQSRSSQAANLDGLIHITMLLVPAIILGVVLLALWTRSFTHKRSGAGNPARSRLSAG